MAAMLKTVAGVSAKNVPWYHELVRNGSAEPVENENDIIERIKNGVNVIGGSNDGPV